ncbi:MAG: hypothetical protein J6A89_07050 [Clostridia bacterium]|nr:hypothetical protein [Clostridia bacterium]
MKKNDGFQLLKDFFANLDSKDVLLKTKQGILYADMSWLFTDLINREIIKKTLANIMQNNNPNYNRRCNYLEKRPEDISTIKFLQTDTGELLLQFAGADNWTVLNITDNDALASSQKLPTITLDKFAQKIQQTFDDSKEASILEALAEKLKLTPPQIKEIATIFKQQSSEPEQQSQDSKQQSPEQKKSAFLQKAQSSAAKVSQEGIHVALSDAFKNFTKYYQYLIKNRKEHSVHSCTISQRKDIMSPSGGVHQAHPNTYERKSEIIPFSQRAGILESFHPTSTIEVTERTEEGEVHPNAYMGYVYTDTLSDIRDNNPELPDGYLFIYEPLDGTRETRLCFISNEQFENFQTKPGKDKLSELAKLHLEMSSKEFSKSPGCARLNHGALKTYSGRLGFYINGTNSPDLANNLKFYKGKLSNLYNAPDLKLPYYNERPKYSPSQVADIGVSPKGRVDRTAQQKTQDKTHTNEK